MALHGLKSALFSSISLFSRKCGTNFSTKALPTHPSCIFPMLSGVRTLSSLKTKPFPVPPSYQETVIDNSKQDQKIIDETVAKVNAQIESRSHGRLFAIVHIVGKQYKITPEDVLVLEGYFPPNNGDVIRLEKVLMLGSSDFSLVGMPLLQPDLVNIQATVIEKRLSHTRTLFKKKRRKQYMRINFFRAQQTMIRINSIEFTGKLNEKKDVEGLDGRIY